MTQAKHSPGPWTARGAEVFAAGRRVADCDDHVPYVVNPVDLANARLIAAAPDLLTELRETADWLDERAKVLRQLCEQLAHKTNMVRVLPLRDEAARFEGRAALIRILITKATGA